MLSLRCRLHLLHQRKTPFDRFPDFHNFGGQRFGLVYCIQPELMLNFRMKRDTCPSYQKSQKHCDETAAVAPVQQNTRHNTYEHQLTYLERVQLADGEDQDSQITSRSNHLVCASSTWYQSRIDELHHAQAWSHYYVDDKCFTPLGSIWNCSDNVLITTAFLAKVSKCYFYSYFLSSCTFAFTQDLIWYVLKFSDNSTCLHHQFLYECTPPSFIFKATKNRKPQIGFFVSDVQIGNCVQIRSGSKKNDNTSS